MGMWKKMCAGAMSALLAVLFSDIPVWQEGIFAMRQVVASAHTLSTNSAYTGDYVYQDYLYYSIFDGEAVIMDCSEACTEATIPAEIEGCPVVRIGNYAFQDCSSLTSLMIPESVTFIGSSVFTGSNALTAIRVSNQNPAYSSKDGVLFNKKKTELVAFPGGSPSDRYAIPEGVTDIRYWAFGECSCLTYLRIPDSVTYISEYAFYGCSGLTSIALPDSVTYIGYSAFEKCNGLTSVTLPSRANFLGNSLFTGCRNLTSVVIPNTVTSIGRSMFMECTSLSSVTIPNSVTSIGEYAFLRCTSLTTITIPDSVTSIEEAAFSGCYNLTSVTISESLASVGNNVFTGNLMDVSYSGTTAQWDALVGSDDRNLVLYAAYHKGDVNLDGEVTLADAYEVLMYSSNYAIGNTGYTFADAVGFDSSMEKKLYQVADVDYMDGVQLADAYYVLMFSSFQAIGDNITWSGLIRGDK